MSNKRPDEVALQKVLDELKEGRIHVYRNVLSQPWIYCDHSEHPAMNCYLFDRDVRGWLSNFIWTKASILPREREIDRILELLAGRSLQYHISTATDPALLEIIEKEPVVSVVVEFMHGKTRHECTMEGLWKELRKFSRERGLCGTGRRRFPGGPHVLSRKLRQLNDVLAQLGIEIQIRRSNGSKVTLIGRQDCSASEASAEASADNSHCDNNLTTKDDREQRLAALQARRNKEPTNENQKKE